MQQQPEPRRSLVGERRAARGRLLRNAGRAARAGASGSAGSRRQAAWPERRRRRGAGTAQPVASGSRHQAPPLITPTPFLRFPATRSSSALGTSRAAGWTATRPRHGCSTRSRARSSRPATTRTTTDRPRTSASATRRAGAVIATGPGRPSATTTGERTTPRATATTSAPTASTAMATRGTRTTLAPGTSSCSTRTARTSAAARGTRTRDAGSRRTSRRQRRLLHARDLAPPAVQLGRRAWQRPVGRPVLAGALRGRADVIVNGHDHDYERFAPQDPNGVEDRERGIRQFVAGTGGAAIRGFDAPQPNSELRVAVQPGRPEADPPRASVRLGVAPDDRDGLRPRLRGVPLNSARAADPMGLGARLATHCGRGLAEATRGWRTMPGR